MKKIISLTRCAGWTDLQICIRCERILGMIRERNVYLSDYMTHSNKRAEMDKFWNESIPIMGRE